MLDVRLGISTDDQHPPTEPPGNCRGPNLAHGGDENPPVASGECSIAAQRTKPGIYFLAINLAFHALQEFADFSVSSSDDF